MITTAPATTPISHIPGPCTVLARRRPGRSSVAGGRPGQAGWTGARSRSVSGCAANIRRKWAGISAMKRSITRHTMPKNPDCSGLDQTSADSALPATPTSSCRCPVDSFIRPSNLIEARLPSSTNAAASAIGQTISSSGRATPRPGHRESAAGVLPSTVFAHCRNHSRNRDPGRCPADLPVAALGTAMLRLSGARRVHSSRTIVEGEPPPCVGVPGQRFPFAISFEADLSRSVSAVAI